MNNEKCTICLEDLKDNIIKLECDHSFHQLCIDESLSHSNNKCPLCRNVIIESDDDQDERDRMLDNLSTFHNRCYHTIDDISIIPYASFHYHHDHQVMRFHPLRDAYLIYDTLECLMRWDHMPIGSNISL